MRQAARGDLTAERRGCATRREVAGDDVDPAAVLPFEPLGHGPQAILAPRGDHEVPSPRGKDIGERLADPARGACNEGGTCHKIRVHEEDAGLRGRAHRRRRGRRRPGAAQPRHATLRGRRRPASTTCAARSSERRTTSRDIVQQYLTRIALYEDRLNAAIYVNPNALAEADILDRERRQGRLRGPLHGIPVALEGQHPHDDMPTTGGALAFAGLIPPYEATLTKHLRDGGAIIIAKTVMTELANWVAAAMPTNYSSLGGYGFNPYDPRRDPRDGTFDGRPVLLTGGSSSGIGTAANFWAANVGTETSGSILSPSNQNMLVGIKPTVGRVSRYGVIPITADQDTPGPDGADRRRRGHRCSARSKARRRIRTIRRRARASRRRTATTRGSSDPTA